MKIAILTFHRAYNCGAMLQAWALQTVLERMGHQVAFPNCNNVGYVPRTYLIDEIPDDKKGLMWLRAFVGRLLIDIRRYREYSRLYGPYNWFRKKYLNEIPVTPNELHLRFDCAVVGSDQVWCDAIACEDAPLFFGEHVDKRLKYIGYAVSYGDSPLSGDRLLRVQACANRYSAISVREQLVKDQIQSGFKKPIKVALDPTLLLNANDYSVFTHKTPRERYLYCYTLVATRGIVDMVKTLAARLGLRPIISSVYKSYESVDDEVVDYQISPDRMISYIRDSACVVASSFHGTALSVVFGKPFVSFRKVPNDFDSRPAALLRMVGELERLVDPITPVQTMQDLLNKPLSAGVPSCLDEMRNSSVQWLGEVLS